MDEDARVTDQGMVPIVGIGDVKVAGLTPSDAATVVHDRLIESHYLNHPQVSINVEEFATLQVSVIGEVKASGPIRSPRRDQFSMYWLSLAASPRKPTDISSSSAKEINGILWTTTFPMTVLRQSSSRSW